MSSLLHQFFFLPWQVSTAFNMERNTYLNNKEPSEITDVQMNGKINSDKVDFENKTEKIGWRKSVLWRGLNFLMAIFFAMAAYVQLNDPDPILWMFIYAIPTTLCISVVIKVTVQDHYIWQTLATIDCLGSLAGAVYLATQIKPVMEKSSITNPLVLEEGREMAGLTIIMIWIGISKIVSLCRDRQDKLSLTAWILIVILCFIPFFLWAYCYRTLDQHALPGHCKDML